MRSASPVRPSSYLVASCPRPQLAMRNKRCTPVPVDRRLPLDRASRYGRRRPPAQRAQRDLQGQECRPTASIRREKDPRAPRRVRRSEGPRKDASLTRNPRTDCVSTALPHLAPDRQTPVRKSSNLERGSYSRLAELLRLRWST